jgi:hypothetical protein
MGSETIRRSSFSREAEAADPAERVRDPGGSPCWASLFRGPRMSSVVRTVATGNMTEALAERPPAAWMDTRSVPDDWPWVPMPNRSAHSRCWTVAAVVTPSSGLTLAPQFEHWAIRCTAQVYASGMKGR